MNFNTRLLHGPAVKTYDQHATLPPIAQVTAFSYETAEEQAKVFAHRAAGFVYSRVSNPTVSAFEQRINDLEGGNACIACASGMAAVTAALLNILCAGDEIIASSGLYGGSIDLFDNLKKFGIETRYARHLTSEEILPLVNEHTRVIFGEVIGNPGLEIVDLRAAADCAHKIGVPLMVDATTATPYLVNPLKFGADIVIHSSSKYINGGGNAISGVIIDGGRFKWDFEKYRALAEFHKFGNLAYAVRLRTDLWENLGGCLSPQNAFLNIVGMETLGLRMQKICENAAELAKALDAIPGVICNHPSLSGHPQHHLVDAELNGLGGGILTFRVGSRERAFRVLNALKVATRASNIGDVRTLAIHPSSTLYLKRDEEQMAAAGVYDDLIRVSVGIEDAEDLIADFRQAIEVNGEAAL